MRQWAESSLFQVNYGLSPVRCQAITRTNAGLLSTGLLGTSFVEIGIEILSFSFKKMHLKMSYVKMVAIYIEDDELRWCRVPFYGVGRILLNCPQENATSPFYCFFLSRLVQVMAWCCQTPNPDLNQRWPSFCDHIVLLRLSELTDWGPPPKKKYYRDIIMSAMASQTTGVSIVYSTVRSGVDQRKHQSSASLAFMRRIHRWLVNSPHKGSVTRKMFPFDDVIMWLPFNRLFKCCFVPPQQWM